VKPIFTDGAAATTNLLTLIARFAGLRMYRTVAFMHPDQAAQP
jgi:hypothetical protein